MGWQTNVLTTPVAQSDQALAINHPLLTQYGLISIQDIRAHALTYVMTNTRDAHHNMICYSFIMISLSENGNKINK